ncbi:MAG: stage II sporulation protein M [Deltaproteobacteria bacterium]|nr:stage II sporulation protein M [Deltaproteobacteria bacterium]
MGTGTVAGIITAAYAPDLSAARTEALQEFVRLFLGLPRPYLALAIFLNNGLKTLAVIVAGTLAGILPGVFLLVNGYVLGIVLLSSVESKGVLISLLAIVPHGLFEFPAILLGTSIGLMLGSHSIKRLLRKEEKSLATELARGLRFFLSAILPLLLVAAFIEAFVTSAVVPRH